MTETIEKRLVTEAALFAGLGQRDARLAVLENSAGFEGAPLEYETEVLSGMLADPAGAIGKIIRDVYGPTYGTRPVGKGELQMSANDEGAKGDGRDDSAAWASAINKVAARGGGVVTAQPGTYIVEGLPLKENVWIQLEGVTLRQTAAATKPMFVAAAASKFAGGGIRGGELAGYNKTQHGIDFGAVITLEHFVLENTYIHDFNRGWNGSQNDRFPMLRDTKFWFNKIGVYVWMNHPIVHFCDFRNNDVGVTGDLNDVYFLGCKFNFNRVGMQPDIDRPEARISNTRFVGCAFSRNTEKGLVIDHFNSVVSCQFYGNNSNDDGLTIQFSDNTITANLFGYMTEQGSWGGACIRFAGTLTLKNNIIANNNFQLLSPTGVGLAVAAGAVPIQNLRVIGNTFAVSYTTKAIAFANARITNGLFNGNAALVSATSTHEAGQGIAEFGDVGSGCDFIANTFASDRASNPANAMKFSTMNGCQFDGNRFRGFTTPLAAGFWDGAKWGPNHGFSTYADNLTSIPANATSVTVTHGVNHPRTDSARYIQVTPTNDMGKATKYWIANVTPTSFEVRVDQVPSGYAANFAWSVDAAR